MEENLMAKKNTKIVLSNQENLIITGISKVISSTENQILVVLDGKTLQIDGSKLTTSKLDVESGILEATGIVTGMKFLGAKQKSKDGIFKRIFG